MARPWVKWYFDDWRSDTRLRMCSLAARGLWADILSYMHEGEPYGHFTIDGRVPELPDIARLVGSPVKDVRLAYAELERHGVFSRDEKGIPFSRRLVRDREVSDLGRECIAKRWKPNSPPNRVPTETPITKKPEARYQILESQSGLEFVGSDEPKTKRAVSWTDESRVIDEWRSAAQEARTARGLPGVDLELEADKFSNWAFNAKPKKDWRRAFINWCLNAKGSSNGKRFSGKPTGPLSRIASRIASSGGAGSAEEAVHE